MLHLLLAAALVTSVAATEVPAGAATAAATPAATAARPEQRYCVVETLTGSRIPVRACHTRAEWLASGFDPLHPED